MATRHPTPIPPFPATIDRRHFASWLSGFCDGEGSFLLFSHLRIPSRPSFEYSARFSIKLRHDDRAALEAVRSFLGCGRLQYVPRRTDRRGLKGQPASELIVGRASDLAERVIPHFRAFPLLAKKRRDFEIWERGVELIRRVSARKVRSANYRGNCKAGTYTKWAAEEKAEFLALCSALKSQRVFNSANVELPAPRPPAPAQPTLFDGLP